MFAIAAFALGGMALAPAFATPTATVVANIQATDGIASSSVINSVNCGTNTEDYCQAKVKTYTVQDKLKIYYGAYETSCSVTSVVLEDGNEIDRRTTNNVSTTGQFWTSYNTVTEDNVYTVENYYSGCLT